MDIEEVQQYKEYSHLNNHYLKINLTKTSLILIGFHTEPLDNILYLVNLNQEEIKQNSKYKNISLQKLYEKLIDLIEKNPDQVDNGYIILKNRIIDIFINDFKLTIKEKLIDKIDDLSTRFSDTRNYYTHYDDAKKDKCLVGKNLKYGIYILDYLVSNYILQNLGFNIDEINSKKDLVLNDIHNEEMIDKIIKNERIS